MLSSNLVEYLKKFGEIDKQLRGHIAQILQQESQKAAHEMADLVDNKLAAAATKQVEVIIDELKQAATQAQMQLSAYQERLELSAYCRWGWIYGHRVTERGY